MIPEGQRGAQVHVETNLVKSIKACFGTSSNCQLLQIMSCEEHTQMCPPSHFVEHYNICSTWAVGIAWGSGPRWLSDDYHIITNGTLRFYVAKAKMSQWWSLYKPNYHTTLEFRDKGRRDRFKSLAPWRSFSTWARTEGQLSFACIIIALESTKSLVDTESSRRVDGHWISITFMQVIRSLHWRHTLQCSPWVDLGPSHNWYNLVSFSPRYSLEFSYCVWPPSRLGTQPPTPARERTILTQHCIFKQGEHTIVLAHPACVLLLAKIEESNCWQLLLWLESFASTLNWGTAVVCRICRDYRSKPNNKPWSWKAYGVGAEKSIVYRVNC